MLVLPVRGVTRARNQIANAAIRVSNVLGRQLAVLARAVMFAVLLGIGIHRVEGEMEGEGLSDWNNRGTAGTWTLFDLI
jgi:hypothetical protein